MAVVRVIARLDPPAPDSFAITPVVLQRHDSVEVSGLSPASSHRGHGLTPDSVNDLVASGHAKAANIETELSTVAGLVALWVGDRFRELATSTGIVPPPLSVKDVYKESDGSWAITTLPNAWLYLEMWLRRAFSRFLEVDPRSPEARALASAMRWTLPSDLRTIAASWKSAIDPDKELVWQQRAVHAPSIPELSKRLTSTLQQLADPFRHLRLVAFSGGSGTQREELAREVTRISGLGWTSFADAVSRHLIFETDEGRKKALMRVGQFLVDNSSMTMVADIIGSATIQARTTVVVDSVRHPQILDLLKWMAPERLTTIVIKATLETRRARLRARDLNPDEILSDPTEVHMQEIERVADAVFADDTEAIVVANQIATLMA